MIELELKYHIKKPPENLINFKLIKDKQQEDIYYDTEDFKLLKKGNFLRIRNKSKLEFKIDIDENNHLYCQETIFDVKEIGSKEKEISMILKSLGFETSQNFSNLSKILNIYNFNMLAPINKNRKFI